MGAPGLRARVISSEIQSSVRVMGRDAELAELRAAFTGASDAGRPVVRVLTGLGGVGKTSLARAYAQRHQNDYDLIWWVPAEDLGAVDGQFRRLLEILVPAEARNINDAVAAVHGLLAARTGTWLLIVDNLPELGALGRLLPSAGDGHVLVTTRATGWMDRKVAVGVSPLEPSSASELLQSLSGDSDSDTASELAELMGRLPLALAQAGTFCGTAGMPLAQYLRSYRDQRANLHRTGIAPDYDATVATTWVLAFERLSPHARALLTLLSFYAPDAIPVRLLLAPPDPKDIELPQEIASLMRPVLVDEITRYTALRELFAYSLVTPTGSETVSMHRLVQAVIWDQLTDPPSQVWVEAARTLIHHAWPALPATAATIARWHSLHTHARAVINHLPPEEPDTLTTRRRLARWTGMAGDAAAARDQFAELLPINIRALGPEHPTILTTRHNLAYWTGKTGDTETARDLFADLLPIETRVLGPEHPTTLTTRSNLARWTGRAGNPTAARDLFADLLPIETRVLGPEDPETLTTRHNLAYWTGETGDSSTARDLFIDLLPIDTRVLGPEHPHTLTTRDNLARWTGRAGNPTAARNLLADLLPIRTRVLGPEHPDTLTARHNLAYWTGSAGNAAAARDLFADLLPIRTRVLGPEHPDTVITRKNLAYWTEKANE
jgi:hypothetical protein